MNDPATVAFHESLRLLDEVLRQLFVISNDPRVGDEVLDQVVACRSLRHDVLVLWDLCPVDPYREDLVGATS